MYFHIKVNIDKLFKYEKIQSVNWLTQVDSAIISIVGNGQDCRSKYILRLIVEPHFSTETLICFLIYFIMQILLYDVIKIIIIFLNSE